MLGSALLMVPGVFIFISRLAHCLDTRLTTSHSREQQIEKAVMGWGVLYSCTSPSLTFSPIYDGLDVTVTSGYTPTMNESIDYPSRWRNIQH